MTPYIRKNYLAAGVRSNAGVFQALLRDLPADDSRWDAKPEPGRFSLREIVAHLVDFDTVARAHFEHMIRENQPDLIEWDEGEAALHYDTRNPAHQIESLGLSRRELGDWLEGLNDREWQARGTLVNVGEFSVEEGVGLMLGHDAHYAAQILSHLEQIR